MCVHICIRIKITDLSTASQTRKRIGIKILIKKAFITNPLLYKFPYKNDTYVSM